MRSIPRLLLPLIAAGSIAAGRPSTSVPPVNQPLAGPEAALERLADGYRDLSPDEVLANLTLDYRFHAQGDSVVIGFTTGFGRDEEAATIRGMLRGVIRNGDTLMAPADSVGVIADGISEGVDPEHPDSTLHYRVLTVRRFEIGVRTTRGIRLFSNPETHVFHLVRGDVALLGDGQPADSLRWYVRRWLENITSLNADLAGREGGCGEDPAPVPGPSARGGATPGLPAALAVHALTNPACSKLEVRCDLPGLEPAHVDVYDVSGRLVNRRDVTVAAAGTMTIEAGRGAKLNPGVYWVRVGQGVRTPVTRMVVVAQ